MSFPLGNVQIGPVTTLEDLRGETNRALNRIGANFATLTAGVYTKLSYTRNGSFGGTPNFPSTGDVVLADGSVLQNHIADNAVRVQHILDGAITTLKIANAAVEEAKIAANAITETKIANNAITSPKVVAGAIQTGHIAAGAIETDKLAAGAVTAGKIAALTITANEIAANAITASKILAGEIGTAHLAAGAVTAGKISVTDLAAINANLGTITAGTINASLVSVTNLNASNITTGTLSAARIAAGSIDATKLSVTELSAISANLGTVTAGNLQAVNISASSTIDVHGTTANRVRINSDGFTLGGGTIWAGTITIGSDGASHSIVMSGIFPITLYASPYASYIQVGNYTGSTGVRLLDTGRVHFGSTHYIHMTSDGAGGLRTSGDFFVPGDLYATKIRRNSATARTVILPTDANEISFGFTSSPSNRLLVTVDSTEFYVALSL